MAERAEKDRRFEEAASVLGEFLARREAGEELSFERWCAERPELADELRRLHAECERIEKLDLAHPPTAVRPGGLPIELLRRLTARKGASDYYQVQGEIARGGQGAVLRVWDAHLERHLAMKVTRETQLAETPQAPSTLALGRFLEEARLTGQLDHPGIVPVHELGLDEEGRVFFTMKLVKGRDLKEIYRLVAAGEEGWTQTRALSVLLRVCEAMSYAHAKGVIHRDLKPGNVMVGRFGEVYVMDWGLARVLDRPDSHDVRVQSPMLTTQVSSLRHGTPDLDGDASLVTMDGVVVGTPAYMSPEQALGNVEAMGPHSDVYSAGAMLYHLLAGHPPYLPPGSRLNNYAIWSRLQEGPPAPLHQRAPDVPVELSAICEKAMAREPAGRYRDMSELAEDLRAYLEHRVVRAYETGAVAELRKWVSRNRALASAIAVAIASLGVVGWVQSVERAKAEEQRVLALANAAEAKANAAEARKQGLIAQRERDNVLRLSAFQDLEELQRRAEALWPASPAMIGACEEWLRDAHALVAGLHADPAGGDQGHYARLASLEERARPLSEAERAARLAASPRRTELEALRARQDGLRRALEVAAGRAEPAEPPLPSDLPFGSIALNDLAWPLVGPERDSFGREAEGLALARLAYEHAANDHELSIAADTLAWALFAAGEDEEALETSREALAGAGPARQAEYLEYQARLEQEVRLRRESGAAELATLEQRCQRLEWELADPGFASGEDRWWHAQLVELVGEIETFADPHTGLLGRGISPRFGWGVQRRLDHASSIEERTRDGPEARALWAEACASIADPAACPRYAGLKIRPQLGLLPCGRDPVSGLWEFVDLETGDVPRRDASGRLAFDAASGLVFVLVPPGNFWMGAQSSDRDAPGFDPQAEPDERPPHEVELGAFFLSKFEMTQGQWERFTGANPSYYKRTDTAPEITPMHPVESVSWNECERVLGRLGLGLPSEAQWECAARGWSTTPWWTGAEPSSLAGAANVFDRAAARKGKNVAGAGELELDDGFALHGPVDALRANPMGFVGVTGNVNEWCADGYLRDAYGRAARRDPYCAEQERSLRVARGGSFEWPPQMARSACRIEAAQDYPLASVGVRPARRLQE